MTGYSIRSSVVSLVCFTFDCYFVKQSFPKTNSKEAASNIITMSLDILAIIVKHSQAFVSVSYRMHRMFCSLQLARRRRSRC